MDPQRTLFEELTNKLGHTTEAASFPVLQDNENPTLNSAMAAFRTYMVSQHFSANTVKSFLSDLRLLAKYLGANKPVREVKTEDLNRFLYYILHERSVSCSPKTYARRLTTLKVFFGFLAENEVIDEDPAAPIPHIKVRSPLPRILHDDEVERLLSTTRDLLWGRTPDSRPYVLVSLFLQTGVKKSEAMGIKLSHIDRSNPTAPILEIRYQSSRYAAKNRNLNFSPSLLPVLDQYIRQYRPQEHLFECTARNLEYILADAAKEAKIEGSVSFEMLRWTCAVRDYRYGFHPEALRKKLGLSPISWRETFEKIRQLASPGL